MSKRIAAKQEGNKAPITTAQVRSENPVSAATYCPRCEMVQPMIDEGETCAVCKLVIPEDRYAIPAFLRG